MRQILSILGKSHIATATAIVAAIFAIVVAIGATKALTRAEEIREERRHNQPDPGHANE